MTEFIAANQPDSNLADGVYLVVSDGQLLCSAAGLWRPFSERDYRALALTPLQQHFIGYLDRQPCWVLALSSDPATPEGYQWLGLRSQLGVIDETLFSLAGRALQLVQWHNDHQYCGRCGSPTRDGGSERAKICTACGQHYYPRLAPCMITLITRGPECLLALHARSRQPVYTALAGFIEVGERVEDTIHREIMEEVGLRVATPCYFGSQPWPFPGQLMLGFHAEYAAGDICIDGEEIVDARWWRYDQLPEVPPVSTLSGQLIAHFVARQKTEDQNPEVR